MVVKPLGMGGLASHEVGTGASCPSRFIDSKRENKRKKRFIKVWFGMVEELVLDYGAK